MQKILTKRCRQSIIPKLRRFHQPSPYNASPISTTIFLHSQRPWSFKAVLIADNLELYIAYTSISNRAAPAVDTDDDDADNTISDYPSVMPI